MRKLLRLLILVLLALSASAPARALIGRRDRTALLWVPDAKATDWEALYSLLLKYPKARFTIAVAPEEIPEDARAWLSEWVKLERIEIALRIQGDPILPLIHRYRKQDIRDRVALGRVQFRQIFDAYPMGFVAGNGALTGEIADTLESQRFRWTAVGGADFANPWLAAKSMMVIPFHVPISTRPSFLLPEDGVQAVVLSELDGPLVPGSGVEALKMVFRKTRVKRWTTVASLLGELRPYAVGPEVWPTWSGELSAWSDHPLQERAWDLYTRTADALLRYKNSGTARLSTLNKATVSLYKAQSARYYRVENLYDPESEKEFRGHLSKVFRRIKARQPDRLRSPLFTGLEEDSGGEETTAGSDAESPEQPVETDPTQVRSGSEDGLIWFENPKGSTAALPADAPELPPGTTPQHLYTPRSLRADWDEKSVTFSFGLGRLRNEELAPNGFDSVMIELYMDLNHLTGRGAKVLLPGRSGFVELADAWEYVLVVNGWRTGLYRSIAGQPPMLIERLEAEALYATEEIRVEIPRRRMRGNPAAWGYILLTSAVDSAGALKNPPVPLAGLGGSPILGLLGSLEDQQRLVKSKSSYRRFSAQRVDNKPAEPNR